MEFRIVDQDLKNPKVYEWINQQTKDCEKNKSNRYIILYLLPYELVKKANI